MKTDCLIIVMALEGQDEFLRALFSKPEGEEDEEAAPRQAKPNVSSRKLTPGLFDALFGRKVKSAPAPIPARNPSSTR
ncbi:hypothetical protein [Mesorhizobium loti]|nr:hypothetical protein [Mesorhizobium loti]